MFDKALGLVTILFVFMPLIGFSFLISWVLDDDRYNRTECDNDNNMRIYVPRRCGSGSCAKPLN